MKIVKTPTKPEQLSYVSNAPTALAASQFFFCEVFFRFGVEKSRSLFAFGVPPELLSVGPLQAGAPMVCGPQLTVPRGSRAFDSGSAVESGWQRSHPTCSPGGRSATQRSGVREASPPNAAAWALTSATRISAPEDPGRFWWSVYIVFRSQVHFAITFFSLLPASPFFSLMLVVSMVPIPLSTAPLDTTV